jgi:hypothetical protein
LRLSTLLLSVCFAAAVPGWHDHHDRSAGYSAILQPEKESKGEPEQHYTARQHQGRMLTVCNGYAT